jgi:hypothetical protein
MIACCNINNQQYPVPAIAHASISSHRRRQAKANHTRIAPFGTVEPAITTYYHSAHRLSRHWSIPPPPPPPPFHTPHSLTSDPEDESCTYARRFHRRRLRIAAAAASSPVRATTCLASLPDPQLGHLSLPAHARVLSSQPLGPHHPTRTSLLHIHPPLLYPDIKTRAAPGRQLRTCLSRAHPARVELPHRPT